MLERLKALCPRLVELELANRARLYSQGALCADIYFIVAGHIKLSRLNPDGEHCTIAILPSGELCGALWSGAGPQRTPETATAKGGVRLYRLPRADVVNIVLRDPGLAEYVMGCLARRQHFLEERLELLLNCTVDVRVAALLIELAQDYGGRCRHGHEVDIRLTQQELAELVGASRPVVSTMLNRLRNEGLVSYTRDYICIDDLQLLKSLAQFGTPSR